MNQTYDVVLQVFFYLDATSLVRMRSVSTLFEHAVQEEWRSRVYQCVRPFLVDASGFFSLLGSFEGVVSGSTALSVLMLASRHEASSPNTSDLDVYVPTEVARDEIVRHLVASSEYVVDRSSPRFAESSWEGTPATVLSLTRLKRTRGPTISWVDVVVGAHQSALSPIVSFWGSLVMNYISATSVVSLYPTTTLNGQFFIRPNATAERVARPLQKYIDRRFTVATVHHDPTRCPSVTSACPGVFRKTEDAGCLRVDWIGRGRRLPYGFRSQNSVPACYWKLSRCQFVRYCAPFDGDEWEDVVGRL